MFLDTGAWDSIHQQLKSYKKVEGLLDYDMIVQSRKTKTILPFNSNLDFFCNFNFPLNFSL
jgi:hypothetical protein